MARGRRGCRHRPRHKILAETNPLDDNDEIQIYTDGVERMRIDACGNVQLKQSNTTFVALDISATSRIKLPKGGKIKLPNVRFIIYYIILYII